MAIYQVTPPPPAVNKGPSPASSVSGICYRILKFGLFLIMVCAPECRCLLQRPEECVASPRVGVKACCELSDVSVEN